MGSPKKIDFEALPAMWEAGRQGGREEKEEAEVGQKRGEDEAEEGVPVKAVQSFTLDEDF